MGIIQIWPKRAESIMKMEWQKPVVVEQEVGLEVTSYSSAQLG